MGYLAGRRQQHTVLSFIRINFWLVATRWINGRVVLNWLTGFYHLSECGLLIGTVVQCVRIPVCAVVIDSLNSMSIFDRLQIHRGRRCL
jgi:hypothetical protein